MNQSNELQHGQVTKDGYERFCKICDQMHGFLYQCKNYPNEILEEIISDEKEFRNLCLSGEIKISVNGKTKTYNQWVE